MAHKTRPRMLYPSAWDSKKIARLTDRQFRLWCWMWSTADDEGRGQWWGVRAATAPRLYAPCTPEEAEADCEAIQQARLATIYEADGETYYEMHDWKDHQRVDSRRFHNSTYPPASQPRGVDAHVTRKRDAKDGLKVSVNDNDNGNGDARAHDAQPEPEVPPATPVTALAERCMAELNRLRAAKRQSPCKWSVAVLQAVERGMKLHGYTEEDFLRVLRLKAPLLDSENVVIRQAFNPLHLWGADMDKFLELPDPGVRETYSQAYKPYKPDEPQRTKQTPEQRTAVLQLIDGLKPPPDGPAAELVIDGREAATEPEVES